MSLRSIVGVLTKLLLPWATLERRAGCAERCKSGSERRGRETVYRALSLTLLSTWQGFAFVAFVVDVFARRIVGWRLSHSAKTDFVLDALEQALYARKPFGTGQLIHHSDRGSQYVSIRYSERLAESGIESSVGSVGDSYDNALAETINGLYKAEVIYKRPSWRSQSEVELATLEWVDWFNNRRLLGPIGDIPPAEAERMFWEKLKPPAMAA
jgi:transposase InsO family protein